MATAFKKIAYGASISFVGIILVTLVNFFNKVVMAKWLGPEDFGLFALIFGIFSTFSIFTFVGMPSAVRRFTSFFEGKESEGDVRKVIGTGLFIVGVVSILCSIILFFTSNYLAIFFKNPNIVFGLQVFSIGLPFLAILKTVQSAIEGFKDMKSSAVLDIIFSSSRFVLVVVLLFIGFAVNGVVFAYVASMLIALLFSFYFLKKKVSLFFVKDKKTYKELLKFSLPLVFASMIAPLIQWSDTLAIGFFNTVKDVGVYNVALPIASTIDYILMAFTFIFLPVISGLYAQNKIEEIRQSYRITTKWILTLAVPLFCILVFFSPEVISFLFSKEYLGGTTALAILSIGFLVDAAVGPLIQILTAFAKTKIIMFNRIGITSLNIFLNIFLVPKYGIIGAALATSISMVLLNIILVIQVYSFLKVHPVTKNYLKIFLISFLAILTTLFLNSFFVSSFVVAIFSILFFLVLYAALFVIFKCYDPEDLELLEAAKRKFLH